MPAESRCSPREIQNYLGRISGPLLDSIDIHVEVPQVKFREIAGERTGETSAQIRERVDKCRSIFILPPSKMALRHRLTNRGQDEAHIIERRLSSSLLEISHCKDFDFLIVNDDFNQAVDDLTSILEGQADHLTLSHQEWILGDLLRELLAE